MAEEALVAGAAERDHHPVALAAVAVLLRAVRQAVQEAVAVLAVLAAAVGE